MNLKTIFFLILAIIFTVDSISRALQSNFNLGVLLMYCITISLWIYTIFNKQIDLFTSYGIGKLIKILFFIGCTIMILMIAFLALISSSDKATGEEKSCIVLGAGLRGEIVSGVLKRRLDAAFEFHIKAPTAYIVVSGGQGPGENIPEAVAMKKYLMGKGVDEELIIEEDKSTSTEENFLFSKKLLLEKGINSSDAMAFSTNSFHCYRAKKYAEMAGFTNVNSIPASIGYSSWLPCYLREVFAVMYLWVFKR